MIELAATPSRAGELMTALQNVRSFWDLAEVTEDAEPALQYLAQLHTDMAERDQIAAIRENWRKPLHSNPSTGLPWLREVAARRWDMRLGQSRLDIPTSVDLLPAEWREVISKCSNDLGLVQGSLARGHFDLVVILGGQARANQIRPYCAATLLKGAISTNRVVALAGERMMGKSEQAVAQRIGTEGMHERRSLAEGVMRAFELSQEDFRRKIPADGPTRQEVEKIFHGNPLTIQILTAPSVMEEVNAPTGGGTRLRPPSARACIEWLLTSSVELPKLERILCVTTPIYQVQNQIDLLQALSMAGIEAEACTAASWDAPTDAIRTNAQTFLSQHYLQELKAVVDAMERLGRVISAQSSRIGSGAIVVNPANVGDHATIRGNAAIGGSAEVRDDAYVGGHAQVADRAQILENARVSESAEVEAQATVSDHARVVGRARVVGEARIVGHAVVSGRTWIRGKTEVRGEAIVRGDTQLGDPSDPTAKRQVIVEGKAVVDGHVLISGNVKVTGNAEIYGSKGTKYPLRIECREGQLEIGGKARIYGSVCLRGAGRIAGNAFITGAAFIGGQCEITEPWHVQTLTTQVDDEPKIITVYRTYDGGFRVFVGQQERTLGNLWPELESPVQHLNAEVQALVSLVTQ